MENKGATGTVFGVLGIICSAIGFFICWWLGFIGLAFGIVALCCGGKVSGGLSLGLAIIELILSFVLLSAVGIL